MQVRVYHTSKLACTMIYGPTDYFAKQGQYTLTEQLVCLSN